MPFIRYYRRIKDKTKVAINENTYLPSAWITPDEQN